MPADGPSSDDALPVELRDLPALEAPEMLRVLDEGGIDFVVIGGFSLAAHGVVRGTKDLDVIPDPEPANLERLARALRDLDAEPLLADGFDPRELGITLDAEGLGGGGNWILRTRLGRLDIMQTVQGVSSYASLHRNAVPVAVPGMDRDVLFAGLDDLVSMKRASGRAQDLIDIVDLERARGTID